MSEMARTFESTHEVVSNGDGPAPQPMSAELGPLLDALEAGLRRYVVFPSDSHASVVALWIAFSHVSDAFDIAPYLIVTSAEKRSGKSRLLDYVSLVVARPWRVVRPSEAVTFRKIEADHPTLLLDESDSIFRDKTNTHEGLRAMLNAGFQRGTRVPRCVGEGSKMVVRDFDVFGPKALAGIGEVPDTVADRGLPIRLERRAQHESVARFRDREAREETAPIRAGLEKWAKGAVGWLAYARPPVPQVLNDRAADACEPLLAIATDAEPEWPVRAHNALVSLFGEEPTAEESVGELLLHDVRTVFETEQASRLTTEELAAGLVALEGPWAGWWADKLSRDDGHKAIGHKIARYLRPYKIKSRDLRTADGSRKGYLLADFAEAFDRYAPLSLEFERDNATSQVEGQIETRPVDRRSRSHSPSEQAGRLVAFENDGDGAEAEGLHAAASVDAAESPPGGDEPAQVDPSWGDPDYLAAIDAESPPPDEPEPELELASVPAEEVASP